MKGLCRPPRPLLLDCALGRRQRLETLVGNRLSAVERDAIGACGEPHLGALDRGELFCEILSETCVELLFIELLRVPFARFTLLGSRLLVLPAQLSDGSLDPHTLLCEQLACAL